MGEQRADERTTTSSEPTAYYQQLRRRRRLVRRSYREQHLGTKSEHVGVCHYV